MKRRDENGELFPCRVDGCERPVKSKGLCNTHYAEWFRLQNGALENERKRRWERSHRLPCPQCGTPMGAGTARADGTPSSKGKKYAMCRACRNRLVAEQSRANRSRIEELWNQGLSLKEIAAELEWTTGAIGVEIARMRNAGGWNLPHRYNVRHSHRHDWMNRKEVINGDRDTTRDPRHAGAAPARGTEAR